MSDTANSPADSPAADDTVDTSNAEVSGSILAAADDKKNPWAKQGALIVAGAPPRMPNKDGRMVIVAENRLPLPELKKGESVPDDFRSDDIKASYPKGADIYYGYATVAETEGEEARRVFPDAGDAEVVLMGDTVRQHSHEGLAKRPGALSVGPGSPVYGAVNLAWQRGARDVKIVGLRDDEKKTLKPWFDAISPEFEKLEYGG